jgi:hypothetical protein
MRGLFGLSILVAMGCRGEDGDKPAAETRVEGTEPGDCMDRADNDGDSRFDCDDDGCAGSPDCEEADADADADTDTDTDADADGGNGGNGDDTGETDDTGTPPDPPEGLGICQDLGGGGEGVGSGPLLQCLEPTGGSWDLTGWQYGCESDWDHHGVWAETTSCPPMSRIGRCTGIDGGTLIGATFDGMSYAGTWVYYSAEFTLSTAESHCTWAMGTWVPG